MGILSQKIKEGVIKVENVEEVPPIVDKVDTAKKVETTIPDFVIPFPAKVVLSNSKITKVYEVHDYPDDYELKIPLFENEAYAELTIKYFNLYIGWFKIIIDCYKKGLTTESVVRKCAKMISANYGKLMLDLIPDHSMSYNFDINLLILGVLPPPVVDVVPGFDPGPPPFMSFS